MAWGKKRDREREFLRTGQAAALRPGDLGSKDIYEDPDDVDLFGFIDEDEDDVQDPGSSESVNS